MDYYLALRRDINSLGCTNEQQNSAAYQVYVNLSEQKRSFDISYHLSQELDLVYILAQKTATASKSVYVPVTALQTFDLERIREYQTTLCTEEPHSILLAIVDSSGTILYYRMTASFPEFSSTGGMETECLPSTSSFSGS